MRWNTASHRIALCGLLLAAPLGCGDDDGPPTEPSTDPPDETPVPAAVAVSSDSVTFVAIGDSTRLTAAVLDEDGATVAGEPVAWASADTAVATVSADGWVVAKGNGETDVVATSGELADTAVVEVLQRPATIAADPDSVTLVEGDTVRLEAAMADANGVAIAEAAPTWASADSGVVKVDASGLATAVAAGETRVIASAGDAADTVVVTVDPVPAAVEASPDTVEFAALDDSVQVAAVVRDADGEELEGAAVAWTTTDETVATVDPDGWVVATGNGETTVVASAGDAADTVVVVVEQVAAAVVVTPDTVLLGEGATAHLEAILVDANGAALGTTPAIAWTSDDEAVATVDAAGLVTAVRAGGETTVVATADGLNAGAVVRVLDQLVFHTSRDGEREIYRINADGSGVTRLTDAAGFDENPVWSPDGSRIAFISGRDGNNDIFVMDADGGAQTNVTGSAEHETAVAWSPDGSRLAFTRIVAGWSEVFSVSVDGSDLINLSNDGNHDRAPVWSPDGSMVAFVSERDGNEEIYAVAAGGTGAVNLTGDAAADSEPAWSPDGTRIAFVSDRDGNSEIYVMNADGTGLTNLTHEAANDDQPVWSPDGTKIAFRTERDGSSEIYVMNADGSDPVNLTNSDDYDERPAWSADGSMLSFTTWFDGNTEIQVISAEGGSALRITNHEARDSRASWRPKP